MTFNRATLDKYLMATFLGLGMVVMGLSSTDRWWIAIGGIVLVVTILFAVMDIYDWAHKSKDDSSDGQPPSKLRVVLMFPICLLLAAGLFVLGGIEGIIMAALLVLMYLALVFLTFLPDQPVKLFSLTTSIPVTSGSEQEKRLAEAMSGNPDEAADALRKHLAEHPIVPEGGLFGVLDALSGGRLKQSLADAGKTATVERTPEGFAMHGDVQLELHPSGEILDAVLSAISGKTVPRKVPQTAGADAPPAAESFLAQGDDFRTHGKDKEARQAYEKAEAHALVDWANGVTRARGLLPTVLVRLGKLDAARGLLSEALASTPSDEGLLAAQALLEDEAK
jgi:hypothetical protein